VVTFNVPGSTDTSAYGINDFGVITGIYDINGSSNPQGYILSQ
jgi:hypothetical protein